MQSPSSDKDNGCGQVSSTTSSTSTTSAFLLIGDKLRSEKAKSLPAIVHNNSFRIDDYSTLSTTSLLSAKSHHEFEALRLSRHDNPVLKNIFFSNENIMENCCDSESIHLIENQHLNENIDPFNIPEVHQFLIRSPPPTTWPSCDNLTQSERVLNSNKELMQQQKQKHYYHHQNEI